MLYLLIKWAIKRSWSGTGLFAPIVGDDDRLHTRRYCPLFEDRPWSKNRFNILLHRWVKSDTGRFHDHPRWSITIVLRGTGWEETPWGQIKLYPGRVIIRSHKYIHRIKIDRPGKFWTLFIVGKWKHEQNLYELGDISNNDKPVST